MSSFADQDLFGSGPHRLHIGGVSLRHVVQDTAGGIGVDLASHGTSARVITQIGELRADSRPQLRRLANLIEAQLEGLPGTLIDDTGESWDDVVMLKFEPEPPTRVGPRWSLAYRIDYLQLRP